MSMGISVLTSRFFTFPFLLPSAAYRVLLLGLGLLLLVGCASRIDRFTEQRVMGRGARVADVDQACEMGVSLAHAIGAMGREGRPAQKAMIIAETTAAICAEAEAWEVELDEAWAMRQVRLTQSTFTEEVQDARYRGARAHTLAAGRYYRAWQRMEPAFGEVGEGCPRLKQRDELVYLLGLFSGLNALMHDQAGGGSVGVPLDVLPRVGRGAACLQDEEWWHVPAAFQAVVWVTLPGSGPEGVDPWARLEEAAAAGEPSGVRLARALQVMAAANADRQEATRQAIVSHAEALQRQPRADDWALLDEYARLVSLHQADLLWTAAEGHRCPELGALPADGGATRQPGSDPFQGEDPF